MTLQLQRRRRAQSRPALPAGATRSSSWCWRPSSSWPFSAGSRRARSGLPARSPPTPPRRRPRPSPCRSSSRTLSTKVIVRGTVRFGGRRTVELGVSDIAAGSDIVTTPARRRARLDGGRCRPVGRRAPGLHPAGRRRDAPGHAARLARSGRRVSWRSRSRAWASRRARSTDASIARRRVRWLASTRRADTSRSGRRTPSSSSCGPPQADAAAARDAALQARSTVEQTRRGAAPGRPGAGAGRRHDGARPRPHRAARRDGGAHAARNGARPPPRPRRPAPRRRSPSRPPGASRPRPTWTSPSSERRSRSPSRRSGSPCSTATPSRSTRLPTSASARPARSGPLSRPPCAPRPSSPRRSRRRTPSARPRPPRWRSPASEAANLVRDARLARAELRRAERGVVVARRQLRLSQLRVRALTRPVDTRTLEAIAAAAADEARRTRAVADDLSARAGIQVPADEVVFLPDLPVRVDEVRRPARRDAVRARDDGHELAPDRRLLARRLGRQARRGRGPGDRRRAGPRRRGRRGRVAEIDRTPGTRKVDPNRFYFSVDPRDARACPSSARP